VCVSGRVCRGLTTQLRRLDDPPPHAFLCPQPFQSGDTPVLCAARHGQEGVVELLISHRARLNVTARVRVACTAWICDFLNAVCACVRVCVRVCECVCVCVRACACMCLCASECVSM
jgi:hypothetical protein